MNLKPLCLSCSFWNMSLNLAPLPSSWRMERISADWLMSDFFAMGHVAFDFRCRSWCSARSKYESTGLHSDRKRPTGGCLSKSVLSGWRRTEHVSGPVLNGWDSATVTSAYYFDPWLQCTAATHSVGC